MTDARITLSEPEEHHPFGCSLGYLVKYHNGSDSRLPTLSIELSGREIDGHYVLTKMVSEYVLTSNGVDVGSGEQVIGVSHTSEEADKRLYDRAREIALKMAKEHNVSDLEDLTRHYQSLPRGGK